MIERREKQPQSINPNEIGANWIDVQLRPLLQTILSVDREIATECVEAVTKIILKAYPHALDETTPGFAKDVVDLGDPVTTDLE